MISDRDILDMQIGETYVRDMTAISFLQWVAGKVNNVPSYSAATQEILMALTNPPMSNAMPDEEKIKYWRKLESLGVQLP